MLNFSLVLFSKFICFINCSCLSKIPPPFHSLCGYSSILFDKIQLKLEQENISFDIFSLNTQFCYIIKYNSYQANPYFISSSVRRMISRAIFSRSFFNTIIYGVISKLSYDLLSYEYNYICIISKRQL